MPAGHPGACVGRQGMPTAACPSRPSALRAQCRPAANSVARASDARETASLSLGHIGKRRERSVSSAPQTPGGNRPITDGRIGSAAQSAATAADSAGPSIESGTVLSGDRMRPVIQVGCLTVRVAGANLGLDLNPTSTNSTYCHTSTSDSERLVDSPSICQVELRTGSSRRGDANSPFLPISRSSTSRWRAQRSSSCFGATSPRTGRAIH